MAAHTEVKEPAKENMPPPWIWPRAAYVHIPFCAHRCWYCDFAVVAGKGQMADKYMDALEKELAQLTSPQRVKTIFIGGGTPTQLSASQLSRLGIALNHWFPGYEEFTVEANPGSLSAEVADLLADIGVNRFSIGGQSFQPGLLKFLERDHGPDQIEVAVRAAQNTQAAVSLDLIFGVPGQTLDQWKTDLKRAVALGVDHISTYGLTYEKGTRLWKAQKAGEVRPLSDRLERKMYEFAMEFLESQGLPQYEISSFARPGCQCKHNLVYWANEAYFGFGLGAARYDNYRRETNTRDISKYIEKTLAGQSAARQGETLSDEDRARESAMLGLRRSSGIEKRRFKRQTGYECGKLLSYLIQRHTQDGLIADDGDRIALTHEGRFFADLVCRDVWIK